MPLKIEWNRKIDKIFLYDGKMTVTCKNGKKYTGRSIGDCQGTDADGEDVDGVRFETDDGKEYDFIEDEIEKIEFLD